MQRFEIPAFFVETQTNPPTRATSHKEEGDVEAVILEDAIVQTDQVCLHFNPCPLYIPCLHCDFFLCAYLHKPTLPIKVSIISETHLFVEKRGRI